MFKSTLFKIWSLYIKKHHGQQSFSRFVRAKHNTLFAPPSNSIMELWRAGICSYCYIPVDFKKSDGDHVVPRKHIELRNKQIREINKLRILDIKAQVKEDHKITAEILRNWHTREINPDDSRYMVPCCKTCNSKKSTCDVLEFLRKENRTLFSLPHEVVLIIIKAQYRVYGKLPTPQIWKDLLEELEK